jgi:hypothetical protein
MLEELRWNVCPVVHNFVCRSGLEVETSEKQKWGEGDELLFGSRIPGIHLGDGVRFWGWGEKFASADDKAAGGGAYVVKREASNEC